MDQTGFADRMNTELECIRINQLTNLGNRAIALGLIAGHGYRQDRYEVLRGEDAISMTPLAAIEYLQGIIDFHADSPV